MCMKVSHSFLFHIEADLSSSMFSVNRIRLIVLLNSLRDALFVIIIMSKDYREDKI